MSVKRGRHTSTCKDGNKTIKWIEAIEGVRAVIIGETSGRKGSGKVGHFKIQRDLDTPGFKGVLTCSYGLQDLTILLNGNDSAERVRSAIENKFG